MVNFAVLVLFLSFGEWLHGEKGGRERGKPSGPPAMVFSARPSRSPRACLACHENQVISLVLGDKRLPFVLVRASESKR
mgnify:CR=1 FL=1